MRRHGIVVLVALFGSAGSCASPEDQSHVSSLEQAVAEDGVLDPPLAGAEALPATATQQQAANDGAVIDDVDLDYLDAQTDYLAAWTEASASLDGEELEATRRELKELFTGEVAP